MDIGCCMIFTEVVENLFTNSKINNKLRQSISGSDGRSVPKPPGKEYSIEKGSRKKNIKYTTR